MPPKLPVISRFQQQRPNPEIDLDQILNRIRDAMRPFFGRFGGGGAGVAVIVVVIVAVGIWFATGFYQVEPSERAVRRLFGEFTPPLQEAGLHWFWPAPIGSVRTEVVEETRTLELGFRTQQGDTITDVSSEALMITGDLNIVNVQMVVQYRIKDLRNFIFEVSDPGALDRGIPRGNPDGLTLRDVTEAALRQVVGQSSIDDVLTINKERVQADTRVLMQTILDSYDTGIQVLEVRLQNVRPPDAVRDAFDDVVRARVDKEARINEALAYQQDQLPRARGEAEQITNAAEAFRQQRVLTAKGEAQRFLSVLEEYRKSKDVTRQRLYLEAMEKILPGIRKFVVAPGAGGNLLQFLPLDEQQQQSDKDQSKSEPPQSGSS